MGWIGSLDKSKGALGWTGGLDKSKGALDTGPVDYTKNCVVHGWKVLCIGELITPNGLVT
jgi:hypothetical protein